MMLFPEPSPPSGPRCSLCRARSYIRGVFWRCRCCGKALRRARADEIAQAKSHQIYTNLGEQVETIDHE